MRTASVALSYLLSVFLAAAQQEKYQQLSQHNLRDSGIIVTILDHAKAPAAGAHITFTDNLGNTVMDGETDLQGELKLSGLASGT